MITRTYRFAHVHAALYLSTGVSLWEATLPSLRFVRWGRKRNLIHRERVCAHRADATSQQIVFCLEEISEILHERAGNFTGPFDDLCNVAES